jgi:hypothetical protein
VREGVFEVEVTLEVADEPLTEDWSANEREEDTEKLRGRLEREKERREECEEVEREMVCDLPTKLLVLTHLPSHQTSKAPADPPCLAETKHRRRLSSRRIPSKTLPLRPTCPVTLADSPHPHHQSPDHARDHVLASIIAAAITSQATNHVVTRRF